MPNTRDIKHYEVYTVRRNFILKRQGAEDSENMEEVAIFDDNALAEAYKSAREGVKSADKGLVSETFEIQSSWVEVEPQEGNFSLPFNPVFKAPVPVKTKRVTK